MKRVLVKIYWQKTWRNLALTGAVLALAACSGSNSSFINNSTKFTSAQYGVSASPRMTSSRNVPKGGGRYVVGQPYKVAGRWFRPAEDPDYDETGVASWYGPNFHGRQTANGEIFDQFALSAAHPTLPLPSYVRVLNMENGRSVTVRVNDRGPFVSGRLIDLSRRTAEVLGYIDNGTARVRVTYLGRAPVEGDDTRFLVASINVPDGPVPTPSSASGRSFDRPSIISRQAGGLLGAFASLFSYAGSGSQQGEAIVSEAHAAAAQMAAQVPELDVWRANVEASGRAVDIDLGLYGDQIIANDIARQFALLGAVDQVAETRDGARVTRLKLSFLKPGVSELDVTNLADMLGLDHNAAYN